MLELKFSEILRQNVQMSATISGKPYCVRILGNITINSITDLLNHALLSNGIKPNVTIGNYDNIVQDSGACNDQDMVVVFYDALKFTRALSVFYEDISETLYQQLYDRISGEIQITLNNLKNCPSVVFNSFSSAAFASAITHQTLLARLVCDLNLFLGSVNQRNLTILNLDKVILNAGVSASIDRRFYYSSKAPYTILFLKHYTKALLPVVLRNNGKLKKALIFDCDNTLWRGILGEDGPEGLDMSPESHIGEVFHTVQQMAVYLSKQGILIGLCSKNNAADVEPVIEKAVLNNDYIVIKKINWADKPTNLREIASELNIGLDSLVFVDDSDFEVNMMREQLAEVTTLQVPKSLFDYPDFLLNKCYQLFNLTPNDEDRKKTETYKAQVQRKAAQSEAKSMDDYLASLHIVLDIQIDNKSQIERIAQLTQKTNQFNLTTNRYTETQIEYFMSNPNSFVMSVAVSDDFGDNGLTALAIVNIDGDIAIIDTLLMSCRVIGRNIEYLLLDKIIEKIATFGPKIVIATYIATAKNGQVAQLYDEVGFVVQETNGAQNDYLLEIMQYQPSNVDYIKIK